MADSTRTPVRHPWLSAALCVALLSGCTSGVESSRPGAVAETPIAADTMPETPDSRSGDLGQEDLPPPTELGRGWAYRIDKGNAEDGYLGSGEPATAREPASVLAAITPLGCRPRPLPMPETALEVTYQRGDTPGVGLALQFAAEAEAARFFMVHSRVLKQCTNAGRVELAIERRTSDLLVSTRIEQLGQTPAWSEGVRLRGSEVMLIAVAESSARGIRTVTSALT